MKPPFLLGLAWLWLGGAWTAAALDAGPFLRLDEVGDYRVGYQRRGEPSATELSVGWSGGLDGNPTGAACEPAGVRNGREAWLLHCPWKGATGVTFQEFTVPLPPAPAVFLRGATALREDAVGKSDGVVCRVFVNGVKRDEALRQDAAWRDFDLDLTADAGKTVVLRFETDPGPQDNSAFDFSLWADRRIDAPGFQPPPRGHPAGPPLDLSRLASRQSGGVVPPSGFPGKTSVQVNGDEAILRYEGADGTLEYHWHPPADLSLLGGVSLRATAAGAAPTVTPLAGQARLDWTAPATIHSARFASSPEPDGGPRAAVWQREGLVDGQAVTLSVTASLQNKSLVFDVACDRPVVRGLDGGSWGPAARRRLLKIPYYSWPIQFLEEENLFAGVFLDWTASQAFYQDGTRAVYEPRTDGTRNLLRERLIFTAAWHLDETLPNLPNPPSPYREELSKQVMLDVWGGSFASLREKLQALAQVGSVGPATAIIHDWQFGGYDNKLPQHLPANTRLGGDPEMVKLVRSATADGIRVALHENYADYYPNAPDFSAGDLALAPDGSRVKAWFNEGTKIQSFAVKPTRILALAKSQGPGVLASFGTTTCYLDVHSAVPPWFHVDADAPQSGSGQFQTVWNAQRALWAYERALHRGPVFGEGNNHWYWSGLLDGVEAQFGQGWPDAQGSSAPLLVNFDLLKVHPLQLNHGMGYYNRWWAHGPDAEHPLPALLDRYRMQEAAYGHQGFLSDEAWRDPGLAWLESHLIPPLTARSALASPVAMDYASANQPDRWLDASATAKARGDFSRLRVRYDNGLTVWANGSQQPLAVDADTTLPPDGWLARGAGLTAGTTLRAGVVSDYAETADTVFANARPAADWQERGAVRVRPSVVDFTPTGPRSFRASYRWTVNQRLPAGLQCFVHFYPVNAGPDPEPIRFQQDHPLQTPTDRWPPGSVAMDGPWEVTLPGDLTPGDYAWTIGLFGAGQGRFRLLGTSDPHNRLILGTLHVAADTPPTFTPESAPTPAATNLNTVAETLDFGPIRTNGSVYLFREGSAWVLRPFPADRPFEVELSAARFGAPANARVVNGWWQLPLTNQPAYRWGTSPAE